MANAEDMGAFGASDEACYRWPGDSVDDRLCRAAFCVGGGWAAKEIERLRAALGSAKVALMNRRNASHDWERVAAATEKDIDAALNHKE